MLCFHCHSEETHVLGHAVISQEIIVSYQLTGVKWRGQTFCRSSDSISSASLGQAFFCGVWHHSGTRSCSPLPPSAPVCWSHSWRQTHTQNIQQDKGSMAMLALYFSIAVLWAKHQHVQMLTITMAIRWCLAGITQHTVVHHLAC